MRIVDLIILIVVLITMLKAYRKPIMQCFLEWTTLVAGLWITLHNFGRFTRFVIKLPGINKILTLINENLLDKFTSIDSETTFTIAGFKEMKFSKEFIYFFEKSSIFANKPEVTFSELSLGLLINVISLILLFFIITFILKIIIGFIDDRTQMVGFNGIEKSGSVLFGFLKALIYAALIAMIVYNISTFFNAGFLFDEYHKSVFAKLIYDSGLIEMLFGV